MKRGSSPERQEYDLEGAAEYLGCSSDELALHLHRGEVRLAVTTDGLDYDFAVLLRDLPLRVQKEITSVLADGEFADVLKPPTLDTAPDTSFKPNYLYLSRENHQLLLGSSHVSKYCCIEVGGGTASCLPLLYSF